MRLLAKGEQLGVITFAQRHGGQMSLSDLDVGARLYTAERRLGV
jgi:hypothetical protein